MESSKRNSKCHVPFCQSTSFDKNNPKITKRMFSLPERLDRRERWIKQICLAFGLESTDFYKQKRRNICSDHFQLKDFRNESKLGLNKTAVPTIFQIPDEQATNNDETLEYFNTDLMQDEIISDKLVDDFIIYDSDEEYLIDEEYLRESYYGLKCVAEKIEKLDTQLKEARKKRDELNRLINKLQTEKDELQAHYNLTKSLEVDENWTKTNYSWSKTIQDVLQDKFKLKKFRTQQLSAINATLSKKDLLLLMPTGGGKTLCYQLPALINKGMTLVVSPLLALMEDQLITLRKLNINAISMSSGTPKEIKTAGFQYMSKGTGTPIKLMYVTPEWLAKSKKFMSGLQKLHEAKKLDRIAIDEVHCCSQWGHDFRPDYKYLGLLKGMFPSVPIIGLTATATTSVLLDIQNMLDIPGCAILRAPFDRKNLKFQVVAKPDKAEDCYDYIARLLKRRFRDKSGIIYTATIKDCEEITKALQVRGLNVKHYHAELPEERRVKTHNCWLENEIQAVVATVAFGMGIDKAEVRFVIHYSVPKSMETLYQESGRAGRDYQPAECIVMYRLSDYLKNSGYTRSKTEIKNVLSVLEYCLEMKKCRHYLIGLHFEETEIKRCALMCDNCIRTNKIEKYNVRPACEDIYKIMQAALTSEMNLTLNKLVELWMKPKLSSVRKPDITKEQAENIIGNLIIRNCIREEKSYTAYSVHCYLRPGIITDEIEIELDSSGLSNYLMKVIKTDSVEKTDAEYCLIVEESRSKTKKRKLNEMESIDLDDDS